MGCYKLICDVAQQRNASLSLSFHKQHFVPSRLNIINKELGISTIKIYYILIFENNLRYKGFTALIQSVLFAGLLQ